MSDAPRSIPTGPPPGRGLYCNRTLNLRAIKAIGYDMDYTLVHYHLDWERRAYEYLRERLAARGWPVEHLEFDHELVVRGLILDVERGNILKANRFGYVKQAMHGTRMLEPAEVRQAYMRTVVSLSSPRYVFLNTLFSLSEGCMYAQLVELLDADRIPEEPLGYRELYEIVRDSIDATHTFGELKAEVMANPERYVALDEDTVLALLDQYHAGKRLLLITNSEWEYTQAMMTYAVERFLPKGMRWSQLFHLSVCAARKPDFFESRAPLLEVVDKERGLLKPVVGPLEDHGCYYGGSAALIEEHLGVSGDEILYLGDHMYGDIHVSKNLLRWRTGLILRELEGEIAVAEQMHGVQHQLSDLMHQKERLEWQQYQMRVMIQRRKEGYGPQPDQSNEAIYERMAALRADVQRLDERIAPLAAQASRALNERWGLLMRAGNDKSQLARQIERRADFYTSRVSNFLFATPFAYLRSVRGSLPHDVVG